VTIQGGPIATLAPGASDATTFTGSYSITQEDINAGSFTNTATVTGKDPSGSDVTNTDTDTQPLSGSALLSLAKVLKGDPDYVEVGDTLTYEYTVTNNGTLSLAGPVAVADDKVDAAGGSVMCPSLTTIGNSDDNLDPGEAVVCEASYVVTEADLIAGWELTNKATATIDGETSNEDSVTVPIINIYDPPFGVKKGVLDSGQTLITWTMVWVNDSPIDVAGATVSDTIDEAASGMTFIGTQSDVNCYGEGSTVAQPAVVTGLSGTPGTRMVTISCTADFGADLGKDEETGENRLFIAFDVGIESLTRSYENQGSLTWTPPTSTTPRTAVTDDKPQAGAAPGADDPTVVKPVPPLATPVPVTPWQFLALMALMLSWMGYRARRARG